MRTGKIPTMQPDQSLIGTTLLDRYVVKEVLGAGGMGTVYRGLDNFLSRPVAVKMLHSFKSTITSDRFQRECQTLARLNCEQVPEIYSWGILKGVPFFVMELITGDTLQQCIDSKTIAGEDDWRQVFIDICAALSFMHQKGVIHRDLKPSNVMVIRDQAGLRIKIMDFGVVHLTSPDQSLTKTGEILGSLDYMSPEHFEASKLDSRSDVFSLGCIMFACFAGRPPFEADSPLARMLRVQQEDPGSLPGDVSPDLSAAILKCLRAKPEDRFQSADDLKATLQTRVQVTPSQNKPKRNRPWLGKLAPLAALVVVTSIPLIYIGVQNASREESRSDVDVLSSRVSILLNQRDIPHSDELASELEQKPDAWWKKQPDGFEHTLILIAKLPDQQPSTADRYMQLAGKGLEQRLSSTDSNPDAQTCKDLIAVRLYQVHRDLAGRRSDDNSIARVHQALKLAEQLKVLHSQKLCLTALGGLEMARGNSEKADEYYERAAAISLENPSEQEMLEDVALACSMSENKFELNLPFSVQAKPIEKCKDEMDFLLSGSHSLSPAVVHLYISSIVRLSPQMPKPWNREFESTVAKAAQRFESDQTFHLQMEAYRGSLQLIYDKALGKQTLLGVIRKSDQLQLASPFQAATLILYQSGSLSDEEILPLSIKSYRLSDKEGSQTHRQLMNVAFVPTTLLLKHEKFDEARPFIREILRHARAADATRARDWEPPFILVELTKNCCRYKDFKLAEECLIEFDKYPTDSNNQFLKTAKEKLRVEAEPYRKQIAEMLKKQ